MKDTQVAPEIQKIVREVCLQREIQDYTIELKGGNAKGEGYLGEITFLSVLNNKTNKPLELVIKKAFTNEMIRTDSPIRNSFLNEIYFYKNTWPRLDRLQKEALVKDPYSNIVECLKVSKEDCSELLVLTNEKAEGFELFDKKAVFDDDHVTKIVKQYAKFHALSFALKHQNLEEYQELTKEIKDLYVEFGEGKFFEPAVMEIIKVCGKFLVKGEDDDLIQAYQKYRDHGFKIFTEETQYQGDNSCIIHGDCWSNNMMFKYNDQRILQSIKIIDWQLSRIGTPVYDLTYCLYSGASQDCLEKFEDYLKIYHDSFSKFFLELTGQQTKFTYENLLEDWKKYSRFGFLMAVMVIKMKLSDRNEVKDLTDLNGDSNIEDFINVAFDEEAFGTRFRKLVRFLYEKNCL